MSTHDESPVRDSNPTIDDLFGSGGGEEIATAHDHEDDFYASIQQNHPITPYDQHENLKIDDINYPTHEEDGETGNQELSNEVDTIAEQLWPDQASQDQPQDHKEPGFLPHDHDDHNDDEGDSFFNNLSVPQPREVFRSSIDTTEHIEVASQEEPEDHQPTTLEDQHSGADDHSFTQALELGEEVNPQVESNDVDTDDGDGEYLKLPLSPPLNELDLDNDSLFNEFPANEEGEQGDDRDELELLLGGRDELADQANEVQQVLQEESQDVPSIHVQEENTVEDDKVAEHEDTPQVEQTNISEPATESKLDELFQDDADDGIDFLQHLSAKSTNLAADGNNDNAGASLNDDNTKSEIIGKVKEKEPADELANKLADLDLELDDDLLLDDDFLEETPAQVPTQAPVQAPARASTQPRYMPLNQRPNLYAQQPPTASQQDASTFVQNLASSKKKSDAYDFPDELIVNKVKPAPRHMVNKYAPTAGVSQSSIETLNSTTHAAAPPPAPHASTLSRSSFQSQTKDKPLPPPLQQKKSFFEDFPDSGLPKPKKAARAAAPVKAVNQYHPVTSPVQQHIQPSNAPSLQSQVLPKTSNKPPPINPYKPKTGTSPIYQQHIPSVGHSGIAKPGVNVPPPQIGRAHV